MNVEMVIGKLFNLISFRTKGSSYEFESEGLPEKHSVATCNLETISAFDSRRSKAKNKVRINNI
jgi:hypothetical protein